MSDRWWLRLGGVQIQQGRNEEPTQFLSLFTPDEKWADSQWVEAVRTIGSQTLLPRPGVTADELDAAEEYLELATAQGCVFGYRSTAAKIQARLDLMGFTTEACRHDLTSAIQDLLEENATDDDTEPPGGKTITVQTAAEALDQNLAAWLDAQQGVTGRHRRDARLDYLDLFVESGTDPRVLLAVQLERAEPEAVIELDLHDLYLAGYFDGIDDIAGLAAGEMSVQVGSLGPVIVVTEGSSDVKLLEPALALVAPAVSHLFRFLDFTTRVEGGADQVVRTLRSFAAAGVMNRVVGVLDNDVAGRRAAQQLAEHPLPPTITYFTLPDVTYAINYPTLGPGGSDTHDVNGRATSIEFQFGLENLRSVDSGPIPVQWTSYDSKMQDYQGELTDKKRVQANIAEFLATASSNHAFEDEPWPSIHAFVERLLLAARARGFPTQTHPPDRS